MPEIILFIITLISFMLGYTVSSGSWKTKAQQEQIHIETLRILLDEASSKEQAFNVTLDVLRAEIKYLRDEIEFLKEDK